MTPDLPLFNYAPAARKGDPATSQAAAAVDRRHDHIAVLAVHAEHRAGLTDFELAAMMRRQQTSVGKRRGELRDEGLIEDSGKTRPAPSGSQAIVWRITEAGLKAARGV